MDEETFERMEGFARIADVEHMELAAKSIMGDLDSEGFDEKDILYFLAKKINDVVANG